MTSVKTTKALLDAGVNYDLPGFDKIRIEKIKNGEITDEEEDQLDNNEEEDVKEDDQPLETSRELMAQLKEKKFSRRSDLSTAEVFQAVIDNRSSELPEILKDIDINVSIFDDETLLHAAVTNQAVDSIKYLIEKKINVNAKLLITQETPLHIAAQENLVDIISLLLDGNADIDSTNIDDETPLFTAIRFGSREAFHLLLEKGATVDVISAVGLTPLIVAIQLHRKDMAIDLVKKNSDLSIGNENPLEMAQNSGELELVDIIRTQNPSLPKSRCGSRMMKQPIAPPIFDAIKSKNSNLLRRLLIKPTDLNTNDPKYGIPLFKAIEVGSLDCIKLLISAGADIEFKTNKTAIECAIECNNKAIINYLIDEGADLLATDKNNENPVFYAVRAKDPELVELLINRGSSINVINYSNMSPLYIAVGLKQKEIAKILLNYQADPNNTGLPCMKLAKQMKDKDMMDVLSKGGAGIEIKRTAHTNRVRSQLQSRNEPIKSRRLPPPPDGECMICKTNLDMIKLIPCGHQLACKKCVNVFAEKFSICPICKVALFAGKT